MNGVKLSSTLWSTWLPQPAHGGQVGSLLCAALLRAQREVARIPRVYCGGASGVLHTKAGEGSGLCSAKVGEEQDHGVLGIWSD